MRKAFILLLFITLTSTYSFSQRKGKGDTSKNCPCCTPFHDQFNFWIGEWDVYDEKGSIIGSNVIEKLQNNCLISENWTGINGTVGKSYSYYDLTDSTWNQNWVDNKGTCFYMRGHINGKSIALKSRLYHAEGDIWYYNKITWEKVSDNQLTQTWEIFSKQNKLLQVAFKGFYTRKGFNEPIKKPKE